jgi:hypothetical protein
MGAWWKPAHIREVQVQRDEAVAFVADLLPQVCVFRPRQPFFSYPFSDVARLTDQSAVGAAQVLIQLDFHATTAIKGISSSSLAMAAA